MTNHLEVNQRYLDLVEIYDEVIKGYATTEIGCIIHDAYDIDIRSDRDLSRNLFINNHDKEQGNYTIVEALELQGYKATDHYFHKIYLLQILVDIADGKLEHQKSFECLLDAAESIINKQQPKINNLSEFIAIEPQLRKEITEKCKKSVDEDRDRGKQDFEILSSWMVKQLLKEIPDLEFVNFESKIDFNYSLNSSKMNSVDRDYPYDINDYDRSYEAQIAGNLEHGITIELIPVSSLIAKFTELDSDFYDDVEIRIIQNQQCKYKILLNSGSPTFIKMELAKNLKELVPPTENNNLN